MVSAVGLDPASYLNYVKGINTPAATPSSGNTGNSTSTGSSTPPTPAQSGIAAVLSVLEGTNGTSATSGLVSSLLGGNNSSSSGGLLSTLLDGGSNQISSDIPLAGVYNTLLYNTTQLSPLQTAVDTTQQQQTQATTQTDPLQNILSSNTAAINAYNQTLLQNAQAVQNANDYGPDGTTKLTA